MMLNLARLAAAASTPIAHADELLFSGPIRHTYFHGDGPAPNVGFDPAVSEEGGWSARRPRPDALDIDENTTDTGTTPGASVGADRPVHLVRAGPA